MNIVQPSNLVKVVILLTCILLIQVPGLTLAKIQSNSTNLSMVFLSLSIHDLTVPQNRPWLLNPACLDYMNVSIQQIACLYQLMVNTITKGHCVLTLKESKHNTESDRYL